MFKLQFCLVCLLSLSPSILAQSRPPVKATPTPTPAASDSKEKAAQAAADQWLQLVDAGKYAESWDQAAAMFKSAIDREGWTEAANKTRQPLGKLKSRKVKYTQATDQLQGAPLGQYFLIQSETVFENKESARELTSLALEKDGKWRIVGYFVQ